MQSDPLSYILATIATPDIEEDVDADVEQEAELEPPWRVFIINDDVTTFEFVIRILQSVFEKDLMTAEQIAWVTHTKGSCYVGTYPRSGAETRVSKAKFAAQLEGFPLRFHMEPEE
ncbi:MAG: ATP-dependent Clp protease adaptor ClpS [Ardenticatenaceae bacterium]|nr:ATP-dependent Clp protease adaptor ClpS [Ardenticatenaceae bacterium]